MTKRSDIVRVARSFTGTRWRHQGRVPGKMLDCAGVVAKTAHELQLSNFDYTNYQRNAQWHRFRAFFADNMQEKSLKSLKPGDTVIFRQEKYPCHCGILGSKIDGSLTLIHAYALRRMVVEEDFIGEWASPALLVSAFIYHGIEDA